ncbi:protein of unknown function [Methylorubrum extorquens]|uniref:Uncharacterized protein n=1 Tax=Methylorubrum extorquens TaxID=408 RepID=A0A2N9ALT7_METEX|nr:protein of unknown function [Methylorubrum extorquens]
MTRVCLAASRPRCWLCSPLARRRANEFARARRTRIAPAVTTIHRRGTQLPVSAKAALERSAEKNQPRETQRLKRLFRRAQLPAVRQGQGAGDVGKWDALPIPNASERFKLEGGQITQKLSGEAKLQNRVHRDV